MSTTLCTQTQWPNSGTSMCTFPCSAYFPVITSNTKRFSFVSLQFAVDLADLLQHPAPEEWQEVAQNLKIPFEEETQYHPEFDGYVKGHPVKQADTVMLGYPLGLPMTPEIRRNDLEAYEPVTDPNGPAMTWVRHSITLWLYD